MKRLWTPAWIFRHVAMVGLVVAFGALAWWQLSRATSGNALSWAYAVEWPVFAGFVVFVWWREVRETLRGPRPTDSPAPTEAPAPTEPVGRVPTGEPALTGVRRPVRAVRAPVPQQTDPPDDELAAYNRYLEWLNANPGARPGDYPG